MNQDVLMVDPARSRGHGTRGVGKRRCNLDGYKFSKGAEGGHSD